MNHSALYKDIIEQYYDRKVKTFLFNKGRVALYAILKSIGVGEGDEVILPAFTCVAVPNPVVYLKAKPVYVDIDPITYNISVDKVEEKYTRKTKAVIVQNTFGLSADIDPINEFAGKNKIYVIEDCAHGFGGEYKNKKNGNLAKVSFISSQWNKVFSTGIGGAVISNDESLFRSLETLENKAATASTLEGLIMGILYMVEHNLVTPSTYFRLQNMYRRLSKANLIIGSNQGKEFDDIKMPKNFLKLLSDVQSKKGVQEIKNIAANIEHRKKIAGYYNGIFEELNITPPFEPSYAKHIYLKYSFLVKDKLQFLETASHNKLEFSDWFSSPIHPIKSGFERWGYKYGEYPISEKISSQIINLPTHYKIDENYISRVSEFLKKNRGLIL